MIIIFHNAFDISIVANKTPELTVRKQKIINITKSLCQSCHLEFLGVMETLRCREVLGDLCLLPFGVRDLDLILLCLKKVIYLIFK